MGFFGYCGVVQRLSVNAMTLDSFFYRGTEVKQSNHFSVLFARLFTYPVEEVKK